MTVFELRGENIPPTNVGKQSGPIYQLEYLHDAVIDDVTNYKLTCRQVLTLEEILEGIKESEDAKANKEIKKKNGLNLLFRSISIEDLHKKS